MTPDDLTHTAAPADPDPTRTHDPSDAALDAGLAAAFGGDTTRDARPLGSTGEVIGGRYHLIDEVGTGGMGSVWRAEQRTPVKRYVAVKLVKPGMDSKAVLARFDAERQALAVMDHPNIARVFDGGVTADGRPYFVMELVKGTPITTFADARKLTPRQRLELFVPVCSAIQHAHMKGVIHRDIKPSNVLVALYDDKAVPKVIDFGVAKATGAALTDHTLHTGLGAVVGTPEYMSPEQASLNNLDIDTRSDVYALGVLLYELLTGSPPFTRTELEVKGLLEMLRVVREVEPLRPSVKLSTTAAKPSIAANRGTEPNLLAKLLRSELDWVVMKALEKDRNRRYDSANGFAADVQRYLAGEAVQAVPPSLGYRVRKWVRKNRGLVTTSGLVAASLLAGTGVATWQAIRADQEADRARQEEAKTKDALVQSEKNREQAEINLVHSYLRPIGFNTKDFDQAELIALDELARQDDDHIKLLFLREAMADGERALRIARRAERVAQAAVGTSLKRREAALKLTSEKQRDTTADRRVRLCACRLAIELGSDDLPALSEMFDTLSAKQLGDWSHFTNDLPTKVSTSNTTVLFETLVIALDTTTDRELLRAVADALATLALRLDPVTARVKVTRAAESQITILGQAQDPASLCAASAVLAGLAPRFDRTTANKAGEAMAAAFSRTTDPDRWHQLALDLVVLAPHLDHPVVGRGFDVIFALLAKPSDHFYMWGAVDSLAGLASRLDPATLRSKVTQAADALVTVIRQTTNADALNWAVIVMNSLAPNLDPNAAERVTDAVFSLFDKTTDENATEHAGDALVALARLYPAAAQPKLAGAADLLVGRFRRAKGFEVGRVGRALSALAPGLDPATAGRVNDAALTFLKDSTDPHELRSALDLLHELANRLDPTAIKSGFEGALMVFGKSTDFYVISAAGGALAALAPRLDTATTTKFADSLVEVLGQTADENKLSSAGEALAALAPSLDSATAAKSADALAGVFGKTTDFYSLRSAGEALAALAPSLGPATAGKAFDVLLATYLRLLDEGKGDYLCDAVFKLLPRLAPAVRNERLQRVLRDIMHLDRQWGNVKTYVDEGIGRRLGPSAFLSSVDRIESIPFLVELLRDPGCVGDLQFAALARLERLAYPEPGQAAVFAGLAADPLRAFTLPAVHKADDEYRKQNRRFRTVSDAAKWLAEHHPEIDLDKPYHKFQPAK